VNYFYWAIAGKNFFHLICIIQLSETQLVKRHCHFE